MVSSLEVTGPESNPPEQKFESNIVIADLHPNPINVGWFSINKPIFGPVYDFFGGADEEGEEENDSPIEEVRLTVPITDDPSQPVLTFRTWFLGIISCVVLAFVNQFFGYRSNQLMVSSVVAQIVTLPVGKLMATALPTKKFRLPGTNWSGSLNPGPFNMKEHVLITIFASTGAGGAYATSIITIVKAFYHRNVWVFDSRFGSFHYAPSLHVLCISLLAWNALCYSFPFLLFLLLCCVVPLISSFLGYNMNIGSSEKGASDDQISSLPSWKYKLIDETSDSDSSHASNDPECCICLAKYKDKEEVRKLPCSHRFHVKCVDQWLRIISSCPLCKQDLPN
ncbi:hypothetical protein F2Q68_00030230 [Brassica cretica]|uniref:RING-type domain-containing protein n=1 Tax=Brassica cretica TaxID=69181 RepID=A0A8S9G4Q0_BRACR|nr:hypothetical protein F2Q68_00030230 [Brassica cretica]